MITPFLKIEKFESGEVRCFCVRDMRGYPSWLKGAGNISNGRKYDGEILVTGTYKECLAYCAGFAKAVYRNCQEITTVKLQSVCDYAL